MTATTKRTLDALVVGGNLAGLFVAHTLASWGFRTRLVETSDHLGGWDRSFRNRLGSEFDLGVHALAYRRSELVTRFFEEILEGRVRRIDVARAIVIRNHVIPYHAKASSWPGPLRALLPDGEVLDDLGDEPPSRERLSGIYGAAFADLIFDEVLRSYPSEARHLRFGVPESQLLTNIHPWFFPRARRPGAEDSTRFQDRIRRGELAEQALYPEAGSFGAFPAALHRRLLDMGVEVTTGAKDLHLDVEPDSGQVRSVRAAGLSLHPERVYWCGSVDELHRQLDQPAPSYTPDRFVLASLEFEKPIEAQWTEIIVGDPEHRIDRISFRGRFAGIENRLVQVEFAYPAGDPRFDAKEPEWLERTLRSLTRLGLLRDDNRLLDFDLKIVPILYNAFGIEGQRFPEVDYRLPPGSNLRPVLPTLRKININTRLPQFIRFLAEDLG